MFRSLSQLFETDVYERKMGFEAKCAKLRNLCQKRMRCVIRRFLIIFSLEIPWKRELKLRQSKAKSTNRVEFAEIF